MLKIQKNRKGTREHMSPGARVDFRCVLRIRDAFDYFTTLGNGQPAGVVQHSVAKKNEKLKFGPRAVATGRVRSGLPGVRLNSQSRRHTYLAQLGGGGANVRALPYPSIWQDSSSPPPDTLLRVRQSPLSVVQASAPRLEGGRWRAATMGATPSRRRT